MKKLLFLVLLLTISACNANQETTISREISTTGYAEVKAKPDQAIVDVTAKALLSTSAEANQEVNRQVNRFLEALNKLGIKQKDIVASSIHLNPRYEHRGNGERQFSGYEASRNLQITLHQLDQIGQVLDLSLASGLNTINNVRYISSKESELIAKAHQLAIENSKQKAAYLAKAYGAELGPIKSINYHSNQPVPYAETRDSMQPALMRTSASPAVYLPDDITFTDQIQVVFELLINN